MQNLKRRPQGVLEKTRKVATFNVDAANATSPIPLCTRILKQNMMASNHKELKKQGLMFAQKRPRERCRSKLSKAYLLTMLIGKI
jgi:hypothetical protein